MFDIAKLDTQTRSEQGVAMTVRHPGTGLAILDDQGEPVTITLMGNNSEAFRTMQRAISERRQARRAKRIEITVDDLRNDDTEVMAALTLGWTFTEMDGKPFSFSPENARRLWADTRWEWLFNEAVSFTAAAGNFMPI